MHLPFLLFPFAFYASKEVKFFILHFNKTYLNGFIFLNINKLSIYKRTTNRMFRHKKKYLISFGFVRRFTLFLFCKTTFDYTVYSLISALKKKQANLAMQFRTNG